MLSHPVNLISKNIEHIKLPCNSIKEICAVTGRQADCIPFRRLFGNSFTNRDILAAPGSNFVSVDAYQSLKYKYERCSSWIAMEDKFMRLGKSADGDGWRKRILEYVFHPPDCIWAGYVTTSYKKHGALRTVVNSKNKNVWLFENYLVDCGDIKKVMEYWGKLNEALRQNISRTILESLQCPAFIIKKIGLKNWMAFELWAKNKHRSPLYSFLCYLLPSQEDLKRESVHN